MPSLLFNQRGHSFQFALILLLTFSVAAAETSYARKLVTA